ncbi:MAG: CotH kinase family protein, partial [Lachnospiraceae bacterium]|nr:CotH kinase family protein [Lachnospiraceae bacterium]
MKITDKKIILAIIFFALIIVTAVGFSTADRLGLRVESMPLVTRIVNDDNTDTANNGDASNLITPNLYTPNEAEILFSHREHFYTESIVLTLTAASEDITNIYYTHDGSPPNGEVGILYRSGIGLQYSQARINSYTIKACGERSDGSFTDVYTHTYFIGNDVFSRFDTLVFSLSTDPYNLYDYDYGILVPGRLRDEYIAETGDANPFPASPANFNMRGRESERPVYVEIFDHYGELVLAQNAGVRVFGGWTRTFDQKSLRLIARQSYEPGKGNFDFDFFPDDLTYYGNPIENYSQLILRNNANDNGYAFLRNELVADLAGTFIPDTLSNRPAAVFINGEYYGFVWLQQRYYDRYLDHHNEIKDGEWVILRGGHGNMLSERYGYEVNNDRMDYQTMFLMHEMDMTDADNFYELNKLIDVENFLRYMAIQIYVNNLDSIYNNYRVYRYKGSEESKICDGISTTDGRWRWLLFDIEHSLAYQDAKVYDHTLARFLNFIPHPWGGELPKYSPLLVSILERDDMRARFITILCDMMNQHFSPQMIEETTRRKEAERLGELTFNFRYGGAQLKDTWATLEHVSGEINRIIEFGHARPTEMRKQIEEYLVIPPDGFIINCTAHELAEIMLSTCVVKGEDFSGFYYDVSTLELSYRLPVGYRFSHWLVNGKEIYHEALTVGKDDAVSGIIDIELVLVRSEDGIPVITRIDHRGNQDYIEVYNPHSSEINLHRFFISDDPANPYKQPLAGFILKPGATLRIYGNNYLSADALGGFSLTFSLRHGETLLLTDMNGETVFSLLLPKINRDFVLERDMLSERY